MHASGSAQSTPANPSCSSIAEAAQGASFVLHFSSLFHAGRGLAFPCDEQGVVNLDTLPTLSRNNYLYARAMLGREFASPAIRCMHAGHPQRSDAPMT
jgi:hypothetical protein